MSPVSSEVSAQTTRWLKGLQRLAMFPIGVVLHFAGVVLVSSVGAILDGLLGLWLYRGIPLGPVAPIATIFAAVLGFLVSRSWRDKRAIWVWVPALLWFSASLHEMSGAPFRTWFENLLTNNCADTECFYEVIFTAPLIWSVAYSLASWITLKFAHRA
ncbi:MAG TPA: hypothetical protein VHX49_12430 [Candidatus Acidoferrales bacterium]|jgi:hypothetical protein|nr:hypothetical protein [Candidatus Acidoferrales bacterium]